MLFTEVYLPVMKLKQFKKMGNNLIGFSSRNTNFEYKPFPIDEICMVTYFPGACYFTFYNEEDWFVCDFPKDCLSDYKDQLDYINRIVSMEEKKSEV